MEISKEAFLPTVYGDFRIRVFKDGDGEHVAIIKEPLNEPVLLRIHSSVLRGMYWVP